MDLQPGQILGPYRIVERLTSGGMAKVYRALQPSTGREVALKVLPAVSGTDAALRFKREAQVLGGLQHPHILPLIDAGEEGVNHYLVMPLLRSGDLASRLARAGGALPLAETRRLLLQLAEALDYAHARGIIHRDLKPANVLLDERGNALLSDFGIALPRGAERLTMVGYALGTPEYLAPEQASGDTDERSDLYSLGVIAYQLATGRLPFSAFGATNWVRAHREDPVPSLRGVQADVPEALERVILKALQKDPAKRWQTAADFAVALRAALPERGGPSMTEAVTRVVTRPMLLDQAAPAAATPSVSRRVWLVPAVLALVLLAGGGWLWQQRVSKPVHSADVARLGNASGNEAAPTNAVTSAATPSATVSAPPPNVFDDFTDARYNGAFDTTRWAPTRADARMRNVQGSGVLTISTTQREQGLVATFADVRVRSVRARVRLDAPVRAGEATVGITVGRADRAGEWVSCYVYATRGAVLAAPACTDQRRREFPAGTGGNLGAWHDLALVFDAARQRVVLEADGTRLGEMPFRGDDVPMTWYVTLSGWSEDGEEVSGAVDWVALER